MFIGEAPGRLGADASEIPFHGDVSGHNFESLLEFAGLTREACFVTNAALCTPRDERGNNSTPNLSELTNCSGFLKRQIEIVDPDFVVTLGASALAAVALIENHDLRLSSAVRKTHKWFGRQLIPLYHPGQRAMIHRSMANQRSDYHFVAELLDRNGKKQRVPSGQTSQEVGRVAQYLLSRATSLSYFALHKLFYLAEYTSVRTHGARLTRAYFVRQKDGPYCTDLHTAKLEKTVSGLRLSGAGPQLVLRLEDTRSVPIDEATRTILDATIARYGTESDFDLKRIVYLTAPMRRLLRLEHNLGQNYYNSPIEFFA
jgi:uracil-DNA glycosylase family 4